MPNNTAWKRILATGLVLVLAAAGAIYKYIHWVENRLWDQNISLIRETTHQQAEAVALCFEKELTEDKGYIRRLQDLQSTQQQIIGTKLSNWNKGGDYFVVLLENGDIIKKDPSAFDTHAIERIESHRQYGIVPPHFCSGCNNEVIDFYTRLNFSDGKQGVLMHEKRIGSFLQGITTTFFNGKGVSYITDNMGRVLLTPESRDDTAVFDSVFSILRTAGNGENNKVDELIRHMQQGKTGHTVLPLEGEPHLLYYRPINTLNWYMFSVVPQGVLMEGSSEILRGTMTLLAVVAFGLLSMLGMLLYQERRSFRKERRELELNAALEAEKQRNTLIAEAKQQKEEQLKEISALNEALQNKQAQLEEVTCEQEAQLEEITALNELLQNKQTQLEEASCEQEAQLEEITALNELLQSKQELLEEARLQAEAANQAKSSFLFNMSHDIRTPMNAIIGFTTLLDKYQMDEAKRQDYLVKIRESGNVLLSIINNVLEMARIEKGTLRLEEQPKNVKSFYEGIINMFTTMMNQKDITFTNSLTCTHRHIMCDETKLREVFDNILSNAYKYTNNGGCVHMEIRELPSDKEGFILLQTTVSDTGIGMSEEFQQHIFAEFSREQTTTECTVEGTGLGMAIVRRFVELMDGTIDISSKLGEGTTITVTLPHRIAEISGHVHKDESHKDISFKGLRILLAEDNELNAEIAEELLKEVGLITERAEDGQEALELIMNHVAGYYDAVLMDIQMPRMNGYEATRAIRTLEDLQKAKIPIIAMTANAFEEDKRAAREAGMNGHIGKPVEIATLLRQLAKSLYEK